MYSSLKYIIINLDTIFSSLTFLKFTFKFAIVTLNVSIEISRASFSRFSVSNSSVIKKERKKRRKRREKKEKQINIFCCLLLIHCDMML